MGRFNLWKPRASQLGRLMTGSRDKSDPLGETCKAYLMEAFVEEVFGREKDITNKYFEKGIMEEETGITLYSRVTKKFLRKNKERIDGNYVRGTPDLIDGDAVVDIKCSWDIFTFFQNLYKPMNKDYAWQLSAYCDLLGLNSARLVYCLVDTPEHLIDDEKRKLMWRMGVIDPNANPLYTEACKKIDKAMHFEDIPLEMRYIEFSINPNDYPMQRAYEKIELCRGFLNMLDPKSVLEELVRE